MRSLTIVFLILSGLFSSSTIAAAAVSNDRVFAFAEGKYSSYFHSSYFPVTATTAEYQQYTYRYYPPTGNYLAIDTSGVLSVFGPMSANVLTPVGTAADFADAITDWEATLPGTGQQIQGLSATQLADGSLYFRGTYQNSAVRIIHKGNIGQGTWDVYSGTSSDRTRVTFSDTEGLKGAVSMDNGQQMTVNIVGTERIEYRNYSSDRKFLFGSVLYRNGSQWLQGLMFTEAFSDYTDLVTVTDVTSQITKGLEQYSRLITPAASTQTHWFDLILSPAYADSSPVEPFSGTLWDTMKAAAIVGVWPIKAIVTTTIGILQNPVTRATITGIVTVAAIATLSAAVTAVVVPAALIVGAGYLIGSLALDIKYNRQTMDPVALQDQTVIEEANTLTAPTVHTEASEIPPPPPIKVYPVDGDRCRVGASLTLNGVISNDVCVITSPFCQPPLTLDTTSNTCVNPTPVTCTSPQTLDPTTNTCVDPPLTGTYSGTYTGCNSVSCTINGTFTMTISDSGLATVIIDSGVSQPLGELAGLSFSSSNPEIIGICGAIYWDGSIRPLVNKIDGSWGTLRGNFGCSGTFTADKLLP